MVDTQTCGAKRHLVWGPKMLYGNSLEKYATSLSNGEILNSKAAERNFI
jgi:hypothetical protein